MLSLTGRSLRGKTLKWCKHLGARQFTLARNLCKSDDTNKSETVEDLLEAAEIDAKERREKINQRRQNQSRWSFRPDVDPRKTSIILFPGQGSQFVGMAQSLLGYPGVEQMFQVARKILGYDLLDLCTRGPMDELSKTVYCQPAVYVTSLAAVEKLKHENPAAIENCITTAGFSVGEFAALTFAGAMTFEEGLYVVNERAHAMQEASLAEPSGMVTVFESHRSKLKFSCLAAKEFCTFEKGMEDPVCQIANYLFTQCKVIGGHNQALDFLMKNKNDFGLRGIKRLPVSGAFHTPLMYPARRPLEVALKDINLQAPIIPVHSNVTAKRHSNLPERMIRSLLDQLHSPVRWEQILHTVYTRSAEECFPHTFEMGPGSQLCTILGKTNRRAAEAARAISV